MKPESNDNVALITGGTGGLGKEIVYVLCKNQFKVIINHLKENSDLYSLCDRYNEQILKVTADVKKYDSVLEMAQVVLSKFNHIDLIVNNAGVTKDSILIKQTEEDWDFVINTNLKGTFNIIKAFSSLMKKGGHIINISSYSGLKGKEGQAAYSASKAAIIGLTKAAAAELAPYNIRVNAIIPGYLPVGMGLKSTAAMENAKKESLLKGLSAPTEVANFILYLYQTSNITGQVFCLESRIVF